MPEYRYPGVYIEEIERGPRPIEGVPTSTSAFVGETERRLLRKRRFPRHEPDEIARAIFDYCEKRRFCFSVIDSDRDRRPGALNPRITKNWDTMYAARSTRRG